eukprot:jgi/Bigna1/50912/estExt_Genewise1.C_1000007
MSSILSWLSQSYFSLRQLQQDVVQIERRGMTSGSRSRALEGKTAVVTGSTSGIGLGVAESLARNGSNVMLNGIGSADEFRGLCDRICSEYDVKAAFSPADLSKPEGSIGLIEETHKQFGAVDILVNNAGIQTVSKIEDFPADRWELILALNLSSNFYTTKTALPLMRDNGYGRIVNIASAHGLVASPFKSAYVAAKHGVVGLTKVVALEVAEANITCNAICPGFVRTPLVDGQIGEQMKANNMTEEQVVRDILLASQPSKRFVKVEELGELTVFLCGSNGSSINGASLSVDGGWTAR